MALDGKAALAMWWDMADAMRPEFEHWHTHEHWPERLALPGFRRAARWQDAAGEGFFVLYELADAASLTSPEYLARLNAPTLWSTRLMPHHRNMVRSPAHVVASRGGALGAHALTMRLAAREGDDAALQAALEALVARWPAEPGAVGLHLLRTDPAAIVATTETRIRGDADRPADWIVLAVGYDATALQALAAGDLSPAALAAAGARDGAVLRQHHLRASLRPGEAVAG